MIQIYLTALILIYLILGFKNFRNFIYYYIPVNFLYDMIGFYLPDGSVINIIRGLTFFVLLIYLFQKLKTGKNTLPILLIVSIFIFQLLLVGLFSEDQFKSYSETLKFINYIGFFFVGYSFVSSKAGNLYILIAHTKSVLIIMLLNILISNIFGLGSRGYSYVSIYTGGLHANGWYAPVIILIVHFILTFSVDKNNFINYRNRNINLSYALISLSTVFVIIGGRRSAVLILVITLILFMYYNRYRAKALYRVFIVFLILISFYPFYENILMNQYNNRLEFNAEGFERENRYVETELLWSEMIKFTNPGRSLFGKNPFDTAGNYGGGFLRNRYLHVDINIVLFSAGFFGLLFYSLIYLRIFVLSSRLFSKYLTYKRTDFNMLRLMFYSIFFSSVALSFSGGFAAITFRSTTFILLGSILGHLEPVVNNQNKS